MSMKQPHTEPIVRFNPHEGTVTVVHEYGDDEMADLEKVEHIYACPDWETVTVPSRTPDYVRVALEEYGNLMVLDEEGA